MSDKDCRRADQETQPTVDDHAVVNTSDGTGSTEAVSVQNARSQDPIVRTDPDCREGHESSGHPVVEGLVKGLATVLGAAIARWLLSLL
ncbi:hypothetical protein [Streptomyces sp. NPDC086182]|jgi:hypothetical protein|uniref:hypothetical protein n=1 Tax=Streptomyces sp. NPDC086182 TaxID=3155058 RepID=UPI0034490803